MEPTDFLQPNFRFAVVGASANPNKYGHKVFRDLRTAGFTVVPVNPKLQELDGVPAAANLQSIEPKPDVVSVVVPPEVGLQILEDAAAAGIKKLWFQPGAESDAIRQKAQQLGLVVMANGACIMVARRQLGYTDGGGNVHAHAQNQTPS